MASRWGLSGWWCRCGFLLYVLWGPIVQAGQRNATLRRYPQQPCFKGKWLKYAHKRESRTAMSKPIGRGNWNSSRTAAPGCCWSWRTRTVIWADWPSRWRKHQTIRPGPLLRCFLVLSERKDFSRSELSAMPGCRGCGCGLATTPSCCVQRLRSFANSACRAGEHFVKLVYNSS